ncbi:MAG: SMC family ATPase [Candidatus Pacearchaeota archaeon]
MQIKRIKIKNIRSYEDAEIFFPKGSVLLSGDIGSGKTSILLSIEFVLFGLQPGQKGASLLKNGKDEGFVELEFEIDGNNVILKRTLKRKKTVSQDESFINFNGKVEEKATTEMKNFVLHILNYPLEFAKKTNLLYRYTVFTPQENMKQIILEDAETRLNTLRHVFGIDKYKRVKENTAILTSKLREISRLKQGQLSDLEGLKMKIMEKISMMDEIQNTIPALDEKINFHVRERKAKELEINEVKSKMEQKIKLENESDKANIILLSKKEQILRISKDISNIKLRFEQTNRNFDQSYFDITLRNLEDKKLIYEKIKKDVSDISYKIEIYSSKIQDLEKLKEKISNLKICPTCLQEVNDQHKHNILNEADRELSNIKTEKISFDNEKQKKEIFIKGIEAEIMELEKKKSHMQEVKIRLKTLEEDNKKIIDYENQKSLLEKDVVLLEEQILRLKESISGLKKFENILQIRERELNEIQAKERSLEIKKAQILKEIEIGKIDIKRMEKEVEEKEKIKDELMYIVELESWLSTGFNDLVGFIEKNVMIKLRDEFSRLFNEWFSILVPDAFIVKLDESFTPIIEQQGYELDYAYLSGGERTAIALAYRLALNQTINSLMSEIKTKGIVILDEPTDGFSQQQLDKMRDVLKELKVNQLIIVSHDQKIESFVDNIIRLKKHGGITNVLT